MAKFDWAEFERNWKSDPKLRAMTERILSMPVEDRLRQIEEEASFFASIRPIDEGDDSIGVAAEPLNQDRQ